MSEKLFHKTIPSDSSLIPELDEFITGIAKETGLNPEKYNNLSLSFSEAVSNSIQHGNKNDYSKKIDITVCVDELKLVIKIKDEGKGFILSSVPDPTKPENILKDNGRGIHIMRSYLDDFYYNFTPEGTETVLVINLG